MIEEGGGAVNTVIMFTCNYLNPTGALPCYYVPIPTPAATIIQKNINLIDGSSANRFSQLSCRPHHP